MFRKPLTVTLHGKVWRVESVGPATVINQGKTNEQHLALCGLVRGHGVTTVRTYLQMDVMPMR